jgi:hypothetical protein
MGVSIRGRKQDCEYVSSLTLLAATRVPHLEDKAVDIKDTLLIQTPSFPW